MTASRVFSSPSFVPLLAAFMSCVIWAEAEGLVRDAGRAWGPPPPPRATGLGYTRGEPRAAPPPRVLAAEAKGGATPRPPEKGLTSWGASLGSPSQGERISSPRLLPWGPVKDTVRHGKKPRGLESSPAAPGHPTLHETLNLPEPQFPP